MIDKNKQIDNFVDALCDKSLSATVWHMDKIINDQMHNCDIDTKTISDNKFQVILTVDFSEDV